MAPNGGVDEGITRENEILWVVFLVCFWVVGVWLCVWFFF